MSDEYVPTTEEGRTALAGGADPEVIRSMEEDGTYSADETKDEETKPEHVDDKPEDGVKPPEGDDKKAEEDRDEPDTPDRPVESIPAWKAKEMAKKAKEEGRAEAEADFAKKATAVGDKEGGADADDIKSLSEEFGIREDLVPALIERLGGVVAKHVKVGLSEEDRQTLAQVRESNQKATEAAGFDNEWSNTVTQAALTTASGGRELTPEVKEKVRQLAYSETYHRYRLADIIRLESGQLFPKGSKTAEQGRGGTDRGGQVQKSINDMSPDEISGLSDSEFDELSTRLAGGQSRFTKTEVPKSAKR